jgi:MYXO-CTERM domain-containing protein
VELSDHNTNTQLDFIGDAQARHPTLLLIPGVEFTTYAGHANGIGATQWVDHKIGMPGITIEGAVEAFAAQGALFSINHPSLEVGDLCIGCAWNHELPSDSYAAVEIGTGGWSQSGFIFGKPAIAFWDQLCASGAHVAAIGGSDDHRAGVDLTPLQSPIGDPTTMIYAEGLTVGAILEGIRHGRTVVKLQGPGDPMIELEPNVAPVGDTVSAATVTLRARITGGAGQVARFIQDGVAGEEVTIDSDPFIHTIEVTPPLEGETRVRAEVWVDGNPRTVTSHLWMRTGPAVVEDQQAGCGCRVVAASRKPPTNAWLALGALLACAARRRRRV